MPGWVTAKGQGVPKDEATATKWFRKAAENGYGEAQHLIGTMYSFGHGLPRDFVLAYMWNNLPAAQGGAEAAKFRDVIAEAMTGPADRRGPEACERLARGTSQAVSGNEARDHLLGATLWG